MSKPNHFHIYLAAAIRLAGLTCDERHAALIIRLFYLVRRHGGTFTVDDALNAKADWLKAYPEPVPAPEPGPPATHTQD